MLRLVGRSLLWGVAGFFAVPLAAFAVMLVFVLLDESCNSPGDSGGCYMGLVTAPLATAPFGFVAFFVVTLVRGLHRRASPG